MFHLFPRLACRRLEVAFLLLRLVFHHLERQYFLSMGRAKLGL